jgi:hypothetical protein
VTIKFKFSSGKEIELTQEEFNELMGKVLYTPQVVPIPATPYMPPLYPYHPWDGTITVTCKAE